jgi:hypothetical protein
MRRLGLVLPLFVPYSLLWINCWLKQENTPRHLVAVFLGLDLILVALYLSRPIMRARLVLCVYSILLTYTFGEIVYSYYSAVIQSRSFYAFEEPVNVVFDPVMGYKYTSRPMRSACVLFDEIQWSSTFKGNNYGFTDANDFSPLRTKGGQRVVVLGDSFTGQPVCEELWPDYVEKLAARDGRGLELLSLAGGGYGIPNWTSLLENLVIRENWDLDEIVFAVYEGDDLERTFIFGGQSGGSPVIAHLDKWATPSPADDTLPAFTPDRERTDPGENALVLGKGEYERFLQRGRPERYPRRAQRPRLERLYLFDTVQRFSEGISARLKRVFRADARFSEESGPGLRLTEEMRPIYDRLKTAVRRIGKPVKVIYIPYKPEIVADDGYVGYNRVKDFAAFVGGEFHDARDAFRPLSRRERVRCFFHIDAHWNQKGIRRFGDYVYRSVLFPTEARGPAGQVVSGRVANAQR